MRKMLLLVAALLLHAPGVLVQAQSPADEPSFEVASIKRKPPGMAGFRFEPGGRFRMEGPLVMLIGVAFEVSGRVVGGPDWLRTDEYVIEARAATDVPRSEMVKMLRSLVRQRLNIAFHSEAREEDAFALVVAQEGKLGPQLRKSAVDCAARFAAQREGKPLQDLPTLPNGMPPCISRPRGGDLQSGGMTMESLASYLSSESGRRVVNKTGLDGYYEMTLRHRQGDADSELPTVFTALSDQLGLRLRADKTTIENLVIDRIDRPSEN